MDNRVYISFISVTIVAIILIFYRMAYACCTIPDIAVITDKTTQGVEVVFKNKGDSRELTWNFGDGSPEVTGSEVSHVFNRAGELQVSAVFQGQCEAQLLVNVEPPVDITPKEVAPLVNYPQEVKVNEEILFSDMTSGATKWEWTVMGGDDNQTGSSREFKTSFKSPGTYTIALRVNGEKMTGSRDLNVTVIPRSGPRPIAPPVVIPPPPRKPSGKAIDLNTSEFLQICADYNSSDVSKKRAQRDRYAELVKQHFGKMGTRITFDGAPDLEISTPDFANLSRILYQYNVKDIKLVPGLPDKNGYRQYKTMIVTLEEINK